MPLRYGFEKSKPGTLNHDSDHSDNQKFRGIYLLIMRNVLKRALTVSTVFSTILWSVGVSALVPSMALAQTSCPAFSAGQMIKVTGRPAIYAVDAAGKVLYFPSGDEFKSWNTGETYGGYVSVSQSCFDSLPVPTSAPLGVNFRPGSYVVKRPSSDQLYVVQPNNTLATITADAARALYGANYKVMTVADVFWPNYGNTRGAAITEAKAHPGMLVSNGGKTYYVESASTLREVTATGFTANRFKQAFVRPVASIAGFTVGSQVTAAESSVGDRTQTGANPISTPVTGGAVTVSVAADNPAATILASGTAFNPVLKVNLTAGSQAASVTGLTIRKSGLAANTAISGVDIIDAQGVRHGNIASSLTTENDVTVLFTGNPINVAAGQTQTVTVRVNMATGAAAESGTLQFSIVGPASVQGASAGGAFPVSGNTFTLQTGANAIGSATVTASSVASAQVTIDAANQQELAKFNIAAGARENVLVKSITLYNQGNASDSDVQDVQLVSQEGTVLATAQQISKNVVFNLVTPYVIDKGTSKDFTIRAKIVNGATRTIQFVIYNNYDVVTTGQSTNAGLLAAGTFPLGNAINLTTIASGSVSFNKDVSSPSGSVTPGTNGATFAKFYVKPTGEDMELRKLKISIVSSSASILTGSVTIKVNGSAVWSGTPGDISGSSTSQTTLTLSAYPTLVAGQNSYITVESNVMSAATGGTVQAYMGVGEVKRLITQDIITTNLGNVVSANQISIQAGALRITNLSTPVSTQLVAPSSNLELAKIELSAGVLSSGEDVKVTRIVITDTVNATATLSNIGNLVLYNGTTALGTTASTANNATTTAFNFASPIVIPKGSAVTLTLKGDVLTGSQGTHRFSVAATSDVTAQGATTGQTITPAAVVGTGQTMTIAAAGSLSLASGVGAPSEDRAVYPGATNDTVYAFKLTAQREAVNVTGITITATGTINVNDLTNVRIVTDAGTVVAGSLAQGTVSGSTTAFTWTNTNGLFTVQPGTTNYLVKADFGASGAAKLGDNFSFRIASTTADITAKGAFSGTTIVPTGSAVGTALTYVVPQGGVTVAADSRLLASTAVSDGGRVGAFKVTNNTNAPVTINRFNLSNSSGASGITYALRYTNEGLDPIDYNAFTVATTSDAYNFTPSVVINPGQSRVFSLYAVSGVTTGDAWMISVSSISGVTYTVTEIGVGFDFDDDGSLDEVDVSGSLPVNTKATSASMSKSA